MAGCGVAFCTLLPDYGFAVAMIVLSGIGIAAFHPEGARLVHNHAGEKKATAMSIFAVGARWASPWARSWQPSPFRPGA